MLSEIRKPLNHQDDHHPVLYVGKNKTETTSDHMIFLNGGWSIRYRSAPVLARSLGQGLVLQGLHPDKAAGKNEEEAGYRKAYSRYTYVIKYTYVYNFWSRSGLSKSLLNLDQFQGHVHAQFLIAKMCDYLPHVYVPHNLDPNISISQNWFFIKINDKLLAKFLHRAVETIYRNINHTTLLF